jgi:hypothetical protein
MFDLWEITSQTWGGAPFLGLVNMVQLSLLGWVVRERRRAEADALLGTEEALHRVSLRGRIWSRDVRPWVTMLTLLGPGTGLMFSTILGSVGMGHLGDLLAAGQGKTDLIREMSSIYGEIANAYLLMVAGTPPMLLGPIAIVAGGRLEELGQAVAGGSPESRIERVLLRIESLIAARAEPPGDAGAFS